ncbi:MAG: hypothetical protein CVT62_10970 [Actinobacteria bacterium HGW-Actinobacteria-2]|nr:MAG: hypothetical protein CVT62_10970 [Actinobacteria bacterium HGW-Actinobacteria-2]
MVLAWVSTAVIVLVAVVIILVVAVGMGPWAHRAPEIADVAAATARHMNGDAEPPKVLVDLFDEIPELRPSARSAISAPSVLPDAVPGAEAR